MVPMSPHGPLMHEIMVVIVMPILFWWVVLPCGWWALLHVLV